MWGEWRREQRGAGEVLPRSRGCSPQFGGSNMGSKAVTFGVLGVLIVAAVVVVGGAIRGRESERPVEASAPAVPRAEAAKVVVCEVCGGEHRRDEMFVVAVESLGYAPDSLPVVVCSELCEERALGDPEKYRKAAISEQGEGEAAE